MAQIIFLIATAKLVTMTRFWPAYAVAYAAMVYALAGMFASGVNMEINVTALAAISFVLAMIYYWLIRLLEESIFLWFLVVIFGAIGVSFGPGFIV